MKLGKLMNNVTDTVAPGVAVAGLVLAPFTGGSSFILSLSAIGTSKILSYGVECLEDTLCTTASSEKKS